MWDQYKFGGTDVKFNKSKRVCYKVCVKMCVTRIYRLYLCKKRGCPYV